MLVWTAFCATVGWGLAARIASGEAGGALQFGRPRLVAMGTTSLALAVVVLWSALATGYSASAAWQRRSPFDRNLQSAGAALDRSSEPKIEWIALPLPYLGDVRSGASDSWTNKNLARWLGVDPDALTVVGVEVLRRRCRCSARCLHSSPPRSTDGSRKPRSSTPRHG
jgi:hypothetical protein